MSEEEQKKKCSKCGRMLDRSEFYKDRSTNSGLGYRCKLCVSERAKNQKSYLKKYHREYNLKKKYGLDETAFEDILKAQNYSCAICGEKKISYSESSYLNWCVDHCHNSGKIRGILCFPCNLALSHLKDSSVVAEAAARYLRAWGK